MYSEYGSLDSILIGAVTWDTARYAGAPHSMQGHDIVYSGWKVYKRVRLSSFPANSF